MVPCSTPRVFPDGTPPTAEDDPPGRRYDGGFGPLEAVGRIPYDAESGRPRPKDGVGSLADIGFFDRRRCGLTERAFVRLAQRGADCVEVDEYLPV